MPTFDAESKLGLALPCLQPGPALASYITTDVRGCVNSVSGSYVYDYSRDRWGERGGEEKRSVFVDVFHTVQAHLYLFLSFFFHGRMKADQTSKAEYANQNGNAMGMGMG